VYVWVCTVNSTKRSICENLRSCVSRPGWNRVPFDVCMQVWDVNQFTLILNKTVHLGLEKIKILISLLSANLYIFLYDRVWTYKIQCSLNITVSVLIKCLSKEICSFFKVTFVSLLLCRRLSLETPYYITLSEKIMIIRN